jgi:hypothetical protein
MHSSLRGVLLSRCSVDLAVGLAAAALAAVAFLGPLGAAPAAAEVRRVEAVGAVPIKAGSRRGAVDDAIQAGLREAVSRVARSFLDEVEMPVGEDGEEVDVEVLLGKRMVPYTTRFRILEDKGERPAMFAEKAGVTTEYVVVVEVFVDADRVEQRLIEAGALQSDPGAGEVTRIELEVHGLEDYGAYRAVLALLTERAGAQAAVPRRFEHGVAVIEVELAGSSTEVADLTEQLVALGPPELAFRPVELDDERAVLDVVWTPPEEGTEPANRGR